MADLDSLIDDMKSVATNLMSLDALDEDFNTPRSREAAAAIAGVLYEAHAKLEECRGAATWFEALWGRDKHGDPVPPSRHAQ